MSLQLRGASGALLVPPDRVDPLSDLSSTSDVDGWGPVERDRSNGEQAPGDGKVLTIGGATYVAIVGGLHG
jgi:alpha-galactosidase